MQNLSRNPKISILKTYRKMDKGYERKFKSINNKGAESH